MNLPVIIVNFKTYESATGEKAVELARIHQDVSRDAGYEIAICVQPADLYPVSREVSIPVFAQHIDSIEFGSHTGRILAESVKQAGAYGTLLNHAEKQISLDEIEKSIKRAKDTGLYTIVCADDPETAKKISSFNPDLVALEPPELIGGDVSVSSSKPEIIKKAVESVGDDKLLVGAGVKTAEDVKKALELGAKGVLLASGVTKAKDPESVLYDLAKGLS
jgi:triosephosphate isomerase